MTMLLGFGIAAVIVLACIGWGLALSRAIGLEVGTSRVAFVCLTFGLGFGGLAIALCAVGLCRLLFTPVFLALIVPAAALGAWSLRQLAVSRSAAPPTSGRLLARLAVVTFAICAAANLMGASTPPNFADALIYHLHVPQQFLFRHAIVELSGIWQHYGPMAQEMLYMVALAFRSAKGAAIFCAAMGLLAAGATYLLGARLAGREVGLLAAAVFYSNAMVAWESTSCFVDLAVAALGGLGLFELLRWNDGRQRAHLIAAAMLLGSAAGCKLNAASLVMLAIFLTAILSRRAGDPARAIVPRVVGFSALAAVSAVPWLIRSWILTGNPVFPFMTSIFGDNSERASIDWVFAHYGVGYSFVDRLLAPWHLFTHGAAFENGNYLSPLPVLMTPVIVARAWRERGDRATLLLSAAALLAIWAAGGHVARYVIPITPLLSALAADALCWLIGFGGLRRAMATVVAVFFLLLGTFATLLYDKQFLPVALGRESESQYLRRTTWYYDAYEEVCAGAGSNGRVLVNAQKPVFYLRCPQGSIYDRDFDDPARLHRLVLDGRYTDVLILNDDAIDKKVAAALGSEVRLVWRREVDVNVSRTFGRTAKSPVAWYRVVPAGSQPSP